MQRSVKDIWIAHGFKLLQGQMQREEIREDYHAGES